ncbi:MAG: DUF4129 domain-containing protein [Pirellulaceae bacterium]
MNRWLKNFGACLAIAALAACALLPSPALAQEIALAQETTEEFTDERAVQAAKEALSGRTKFPFYDRQKDDVRQLNVEPPKDADSANRKTKWAGKGTKSKARSTAGGNSAGLLGGLLQGFGLTLLVVAIVALALLIAWAFLKQETTETAAQKVIETSREVDRVEALPFQVRKPTGDFLSEARRLYEGGNYSEAIVYLYSYQLVQLDKHHVLRLAKGKTNRQYLRETRPRPVLRDILDQTMISFEDVFFGQHPLGREPFEACWRRLDEFHGELERLERAAA